MLRPKTWPYIRYYLPLFLVLIIINIGASFFMLHDFSNAYFGASFLQANNFDASIYDALAFNQKVAQAGWKNMFVAYYPNTPFLAFFFTPLTVIKSPFLAKIIFNALSSFLFLFSLYRLQKKLQFAPWLLWLIPLLFLIPIKNNLYFGQVYFLIFFLLTEGYLALEKQRYFQLGFFWSLALMLKVFPIILVGFLFLQKRFLGLGAFFLFSLLLVIFSLSMLDIELWNYYLTEVLPRANKGDYYDGFTPAAKSATMLFKNLWIADSLLNPQPLISSHSLYIATQSLYKSMLLAPVIGLSLSRPKQSLSIFSFWVMLMLLLSPALSSYASILLIFPLLVVSQSTASIRYKIAFGFLILLYCNLPIAPFLKFPLLFQFPKVYLLLALFTSYYFHLPKGRKKTTLFLFFSLIFALLLALGFAQKKPLKNSYAIEKEEQILIMDYTVKNQQLVYQYWTVPEPQYKRTTIPIFSIDSSNIFIQNNQIFYKNKQLTQDKSLKRKALVINANEIWYLSDRNRGIGFYTLLKIAL